MDQFYTHYDSDGRRWRRSDLTGAGTRNGETGLVWRGIDVTAKGRHWAYPPSVLEEMDSKGMIHWPQKEAGMPMLKRFADEQKGVPLQDVMTDIPPIHNMSQERRGYPTQKPLALLERIIAASSNEGDVVLDPFAGCGTAIVAAERMNRRWIGIDITYLAINEIIDRLNTERVKDKPLVYELIGTPKDAGGAAQLFHDTERQNHKPFEQFAVSLVQGKWNEKKGADRGIDGRVGLWNLKGDYCEALVQVKGGNALTLSTVRDFRGTIEREKAVMGLIIAQKEPTKEMLIEAESAGYADWYPPEHYPRLQIRTMKDLLENPRKPFLVPETSRIPPQQGVGKAVEDKQMSLMED